MLSLAVAAGTLIGSGMVGLVILRVAGLIRPFAVPNSGMSPAIVPGDHILMEGFTYRARPPRRGDIVVFKTDGIDSEILPSSQFFVKRLAGEPGDKLRIANGRLYVNGASAALSNETGLIRYIRSPGSRYLRSDNDIVSVPSGHYFVLGDNSTNSFDGRYWGFLPARNILGRAGLCFWPPSRIGGIK